MSGIDQPGAVEAQPLLSVVVPMYNVESYLPECLDSILGQSYRQVEVIAVDDGSTDATGDIARDYARRDERVRVVAQENAGLGAARNAGARHATGRFLAFVDSDDTVPAGAYDRLVTTLLETGSQLAVGAMEELIDGRYRVPAWLVPIHRQQRLGVRVDEAPDVLHNAFAVDKVFVRTFWADAGLAFPVGVYYEDHVPMTRAYLTARAIDILPDVAYRWRTRSDGSSITQRKHELRNLVDALAAKQEVNGLVSRTTAASTVRHWHSFMFDDLRPYIRQVANASDEYWSTLRDGVRSLLDRASGLNLADVAVRVRLMVWLVAQDRRSDVEALIARLQDGASRPALVRQDGRDVLHLEGLVGPGAPVPAALFDLAPSDRQLRARLVEVVRPDPSSVRLTGWVQLIGVCDRPVTPTLSLRLRDRHSVAAEVSVAATLQGTRSGGLESPAPGAPPAWEFAVVVSLPEQPAEWTVDVVVELGDVTVAGPFTGISRPARSVVGAPTDGRPGLALSWHPGPGLVLTGCSETA